MNYWRWQRKEEHSGVKHCTAGSERFFPLFCVAWLCRLLVCLPGMCSAQGGTVNLPQRHQSQNATTGDEAARIAQPPAAPNQELRKASKTALICPLFLSFPFFSVSMTLLSVRLFMLPLSRTLLLFPLAACLALFMKHDMTT